MASRWPPACTWARFALIESHPRFRDAKLGIIVSSLRALQLFLKKNSRLNRLPDYIVVEGPLAGGHLGFGMDWAQYDLATIVAEILQYLKTEQLAIPVIPAGGIFTGSDAVRFMEMGAAGVQVATRFTVTHECGLPDDIKQEYFKAVEDDIEVNEISPTGYPMRMIKASPGIGDGIRPNCEAYGYLLDANGKCAYITAYNREVAAHPDEKRISVKDKTCLCTQMRNFRDLDLRAIGLAPEGHLAAPARWQLPAAQRRTRLQDYQFSVEDQVRLPQAEDATASAV
jgi:nitronate monooxygenase